jgi:hypothetical protein
MKRILIQLSVLISLFLVLAGTALFAQAETKNRIKIAHFQIFAFDNSIEQNRAKADKYCRIADSLGADIAVLPELYSIGCGYNEPVIIEDWLEQAT